MGIFCKNNPDGGDDGGKDFSVVQERRSKAGTFSFADDSDGFAGAISLRFLYNFC